MLRRLYPYWLAARPETVGGLAALLLAGALEVLQPWPVKWLVDSVFGTHAAPRWLAAVWPGMTHGDRASGVAAVCIAILFLAFGHKLMQLISQWLLIRAGLKLVRGLRSGVSDHLHRLPLAFHDKSKVADLVYRAAWDSYAAQSVLSQAAAPALGGIVILAGILLVMLRLDPLLTLIALATTPACWLMIKGFGRAIEARAKLYHDQESSLLCRMQESLSSIRAVQAFTHEGQVSAKVAAEAARSFALNERLCLMQLAFTFCIGITMAAGTAAVVFVGARRVSEGRMTLGDILVFLAYTGMLYTPVSAFTQGAAALRSARIQLQRVFNILDIAPAIADRAHAQSPAKILGKIEFREMRFAYQPGLDVIKGISGMIEPGTSVALVGRTGSGKSTIASLLLRFYDPTAGCILLDGIDLRDLRVERLRESISIVLQDAILFSDTIAANIAMGRVGARTQEIVEAAQSAQADEFIRSLPNGYDTILGERGVNLSGGQRQRIAIARAFLKNAPILILDEPTAALDAHTEAALVEATGRLMAGRTTFIIAHRLSTVRTADIVWVLSDGKIIERGSHEQLMSVGGSYRRLCERQWGQALQAPVGLQVVETS